MEMHLMRRLLLILAVTVLAGFSAACSSSDHAETVRLDAADAVHEGAVEYKWDVWVVWCGHNLCDGSYTWRFPESGKFEFLWDVNHKCAGAPPYRLMINNRVVAEGAVPQHGSCDACTGNNIRHNPDEAFRKFKTISLGTHRIRRGDSLKLWINNSFACGIENPGAYGDFLEMVAEPG